MKQIPHLSTPRQRDESAHVEVHPRLACLGVSQWCEAASRSCVQPELEYTVRQSASNRDSCTDTPPSRSRSSFTGGFTIEFHCERLLFPGRPPFLPQRLDLTSSGASMSVGGDVNKSCDIRSVSLCVANDGVRSTDAMNFSPVALVRYATHETSPNSMVHLMIDRSEDT